MHEASLAQLLRVVGRGLGALNAAHRAPLDRALAAALALNPNQHFTILTKLSTQLAFLNSYLKDGTSYTDTLLLKTR